MKVCVVLHHLPAPGAGGLESQVHDLCAGLLERGVNVRVDFEVQRNADIGSPRVTGSTSASNAASSPGSVAVKALRPPPGRRTRPVGAAPDSSSRRPFATVSGDTPAAAATSFTPPRPTSRASAPSTSRRCRSSRCGHSDAHLRATPSSTTDIPRA